MAVYSANGNQLSSVYDSNGNKLSAAYNSSGVKIYSAVEEPKADYSQYASTVYSTIPCVQGFAIFGGYLFAATGDGKCKIIDTANSTLLQTVNITTGHGNSVSFSNEYLNSGDEFPLMYVSKDQGDPCDVYVYHVTRVGNEFSIELIRTLRWQLSQVGYFANASVDSENGIVYMYGYSQNNWQSDSGGNVMILTAWNLSQLTENGDDTFTPAFVKQIITNHFVYAHFGQTFHDGKVWSGTPDVGYADPRAFSIDTTTGNIVDTIHLPTNGEAEGICFLDYLNAVVGYYGESFYKLTFEEASP